MYDKNICFFCLFVVLVTSGDGSIFTMLRFEKEHSSPNLKVTTGLAVKGHFLLFWKISFTFSNYVINTPNGCNIWKSSFASEAHSRGR